MAAAGFFILTKIKRGLMGKQFTSEYQPKKNGRHKGRTPTDWLRRLSHTKIDFQNPLTGKSDKAEINLVVAIQLILKATQDSDLPSIKEYFDRLDGKVIQQIKGEVEHEHTVFLENIISKLETAPSRLKEYVSHTN
jgi:hypothetical protein